MATLELFTYIYSSLFMDCCRSMFPFEKELCDLQNVSNIQSHVLPSISVLVGKRLAEAIERAQKVFTVLLFIPHPFSIALQHPPTSLPGPSPSLSQSFCKSCVSAAKSPSAEIAAHASGHLRASSSGKQVTGFFTDGEFPVAISQDQRENPISVMLWALYNYPSDFCQSL